MYEYERFEIRIEGDASGGYRVHGEGLKGRSARGHFELPVTDTELENFALKVGRRARGARSKSSPQIAQARELGGALFNALFQQDVREIYRESIAEAADSDKGVRLTLHLTDVPELMHIPGNISATTGISCASASRLPWSDISMWPGRTNLSRCSLPSVSSA